MVTNYHLNIEHQIKTLQLFPEKWIFLVADLGIVFFDYLYQTNNCTEDGWTMVNTSCSILAAVCIDRRLKVKDVLSHISNDQMDYKNFPRVFSATFRLLREGIAEKVLTIDPPVLIGMKEYLIEIGYWHQTQES